MQQETGYLGSWSGLNVYHSLTYITGDPVYYRILSRINLKVFFLIDINVSGLYGAYWGNT